MLGRTLLAGGALAVALWPAAASAAPLAEEPTPPALLVSRSDDRSDAGPLEGATLSGTEPLFVFVGPDDAVDDVDEVRFALDGRTVSTERFVNFDLAGTDGFDTVGCNTCP